MMGAHARLLVIVLVGLVLVPSCRKRLSAQDQVRDVIADAVLGVRERKVKKVAAIVSSQYRDKEGHDRQAVLDLVRAQVLLRPNIYLFTRVMTVECEQPGSCSAVVIAAMASVPMQSPADLARAQADVYRFDLDFVDEDGDWRVRRAGWAQAGVKDLL